MQVKPSSQPIIVSIPICHSDDTEAARASRRQLKEAKRIVLFDMNAPAVCAIDQAVLALYAPRRTSGIVVNIGFHGTSVVQNFRASISMNKASKNLCYVAADYNVLQKDTQASCEVSDEGIFTSSKEHFQAAEIFSSCKLEGCVLWVCV